MNYFSNWVSTTTIFSRYSGREPVLLRLRFSEVHEFEKPNDEHALNLMNSCAVAVLQDFEDIIFSYGVSDEYSFILRKESQFYQRHQSKIVSVVVSFFTSTYIMKWREFFPNKEMRYPPSFDGRAVCYPSYEILRDYLSWRQVDCHINNQYNTCFWMLVKYGKSKSEAQKCLKGTQAQEKNELLKDKFGIDYNELPIMFRRGSSVFKKESSKNIKGGTAEKSKKEIIVDHSDIITDSFWIANPYILDESPSHKRELISFPSGVLVGCAVSFIFSIWMWRARSTH